VSGEKTKPFEKCINPFTLNGSSILDLDLYVTPDDGLPSIPLLKQPPKHQEQQQVVDYADAGDGYDEVPTPTKQGDGVSDEGKF